MLERLFQSRCEFSDGVDGFSDGAFSDRFISIGGGCKSGGYISIGGGCITSRRRTVG